LITALIVAVLVLLTGLLGRRLQGPEPPGGAVAGQAGVRNFYSPRIGSDPYVLDQQRLTVEAMELQCGRFGEHCPEAKRARAWLEKAKAAS
jgi:hypothetical protein